MKKFSKISFFLFIATALLVTACKKDNRTPSASSLAAAVQGTYTGQLKSSATGQLKGSVTGQTDSATMTITAQNDSVVTMQCVSNQFDTTVTVMLYQDYDTIMPCFTDQDYYRQYGRKLDNSTNFCTNRSQNWSNNQWGNNQNMWWGNEKEQWNAWTNHMNTQHQPGDRHFGRFNPDSDSCTYTFQVNTGDSTYYQTFSGVKN